KSHVMRKRAITCLAILLIFGAIAVWLCSPQRIGGLSRHDLVAIKSLVHQWNGREDILPDASWQSIRRRPAAVRRPRGKILSITAVGDGVEVESLLATAREKVSQEALHSS